MNELNSKYSLSFEKAGGHCPAGETFSSEMMTSRRTPVISCEGSCIRGEIARLAANMLAKEKGYGRGCHGEILSVPESGMAKWAAGAEKIVVIDGCFLHCHGRMMAGIFPKTQLAVFDALSFYGKYTNVMDIDDIPPKEREHTAKEVFGEILCRLESGNLSACNSPSGKTTGCCGK